MIGGHRDTLDKICRHAGFPWMGFNSGMDSSQSPYSKAGTSASVRRYVFKRRPSGETK